MNSESNFSRAGIVLSYEHKHDEIFFSGRFTFYLRDTLTSFFIIVMSEERLIKLTSEWVKHLQEKEVFSLNIFVEFTNHCLIGV